MADNDMSNGSWCPDEKVDRWVGGVRARQAGESFVLDLIDDSRLPRPHKYHQSAPASPPRPGESSSFSHEKS